MSRSNGPGEVGPADRIAVEAVERLGARVWILGALMIVIGIVSSVLMFRDFRSDSYLYLAFYLIPSNTALSVFPHEPVLLYFGKFGVLWVVAVVATAGNLVAAVLDHAVFVPVLNHRSLQGYKTKTLYRRAMLLFRRSPFATVVLASLAPVPFWPIKFLAFSGGYPLRRYLVGIAVGRLPRYYLLAWLGATIAIPTWVLIAVVALVVVIYGVNVVPKLVRRRRARRAAERVEPATGTSGATGTRAVGRRREGGAD